jgi:hypothetical protein
MVSDKRRLTFKLNNFHRIAFFAYTKDLQVTEYRLFGFGVTVNFDTKEITMVLPIQFTLRDCKINIDKLRLNHRALPL